MFALLILLAAPAHSMSPAGAAWSSAGVAVGAGVTFFVPGTYGYAAAVNAPHPPECGEFPDCEGYGYGLMMGSMMVGGTASYGLSAATAGAIVPLRSH